jgi:hypothetical protein
MKLIVEKAKKKIVTYQLTGNEKESKGKQNRRSRARRVESALAISVSLNR